MSYNHLVKRLHEKTGKWVGILGIDYEYDRSYKPSESKEANKILINYWNEGGLIAVGFSPINPWIIDELDLDNNPGFWTDTRTTDLTDEQVSMIDLCKLIDPNESVYAIWRRKLDRIADGLLEL